MGKLDVVFVLICISLLADALDGAMARWLKVSSPLGVQLDSLADMISFGLLPGVIMFYILQRYGTSDFFVGWTVLAFLIPVSAGLRLAKFNLDTRESKYFYGLPTPAGALVAFGLLWMINFPQNQVSQILSSPYFLYAVIIGLTLLFHAPFNMLSLKGEKSSFIWLGILVVLGLVLFFVQKDLAIVAPALAYILLGFIQKVAPIY